MKNKSLWVLLLVGLWLLSPFVFNGLQPNNYTGGNTRDEQQRQLRNSSAAARMLGGIRTSVSDIMFLKIESYMHEGVGYEPHITEVESVSSLIKEEVLAGTALSKEEEVTEDPTALEAEHIHSEECEHAQDTKKVDVAERDDPSGHDHEEEHIHSDDCDHGPGIEGENGEILYAGETSIPSEEKDYRGIIGNLYRKVKPWSGAALHKHSKGEEMLPWFKVMTLADPHYIRGYTVGAYWLSRTDVDAALKYIDEGAKNNPQSYEVQLIYGQILYKKAQNIKLEMNDSEHPLAYVFLQKSLEHFSKGVDLVLPLRPPEGQIDEHWTLNQEQDAWSAVSMSLSIESRYGDPDRAKKRAQEFKKIMPDNPSIERIINPTSSFVPEYFN